MNFFQGLYEERLSSREATSPLEGFYFCMEILFPSWMLTVLTCYLESRIKSAT